MAVHSCRGRARGVLTIVSRSALRRPPARPRGTGVRSRVFVTVSPSPAGPSSSTRHTRAQRPSREPGAPAGQTRATPRPGTATPSSVQCRAVWRLCTCHVAVATNTSQGDYNHAYTHSQRMSTTGSQSSIDFSMDTDLKISVSALRPDAHVLSQSR